MPFLRTATRVYDFMLNSIKSRLLQKGSRQAGQSTEPVIAPQGLASVNTELSEITGRFSRVVSHNMAVFAPFYEDILVDIKNSWHGFMIGKRHITMYLCLYGRHYLSITPFFFSNQRKVGWDRDYLLLRIFPKFTRHTFFLFFLSRFSHIYYITEKIVHTITSTNIFILITYHP